MGVLPSLNVSAAMLRRARGTPACPLVNASRRGALPPDKAANLRWWQPSIRGISCSPQGTPSTVTACSVTPFNAHAVVPAVRVLLPWCDSRFLNNSSAVTKYLGNNGAIKRPRLGSDGNEERLTKAFFFLSLPFNLPWVRSSSSQPMKSER